MQINIKRRNNKINPYIVIFLFLFIYSPWILSINISHILFVISLFFVLKDINCAFTILQKTKLSKLLILFSFVFCYVLFIILISGAEIINTYPYILFFFEIPVVILYLNLYFFKKGYSFNDLINLVFIVSMIQAILGILAFLSNDIKQFLINSLINNISEIDREKIILFSWYRFNGFSGFLNYSTPITQVVIASMSLYKGLYLKEKKYLLITPFLIFSAIINARITFVIILISVLLLVFYSGKFMNFIKFIGLFMVVPIVTYPFTAIIDRQTGYVGIWIRRGLQEVLGLFVGNSESTITVNALLQTHLILPDVIGFLFGRGHDIYGKLSKLGFASDIGYINNIWFMGIFMTLILISGISIYFLKINKKNNNPRFMQFLSTMFIITFLVSNIKGSIVSYNDFMVLSLLLTSASFILFNKD